MRNSVETIGLLGLVFHPANRESLVGNTAVSMIFFVEFSNVSAPRSSSLRCLNKLKRTIAESSSKNGIEETRPFK